MSNAPGVDEADTWLWGDDDGRAAWPPREWSHPAGGFPGAPGPYPGRPPAWGPPGSYPPPSPYAGGPEPHRQPGPQPAGEPIRQPFPRGGQQPPASRAADPESTQAYDFSDDPDLSDEVPPRQDSTDQSTQQMPAADTGGATQQMPAPEPGATQQMPAPDPEADRTRQLPRVRDE
jgi:protein LSM14